MQISIENAEQLYLSNIKMICQLAYNITKNKENADDLKQEAYFILLDSIKRFDPSRNVKFTTYLNSCLRKSFKTKICYNKAEYKRFDHDGYIFRQQMIRSDDRGEYFYSKYNKIKDIISKNCQERDRKVFNMYSDGVNTKRIAHENNISIQTVFNILERIEKGAEKLLEKA
jgi:RNA polymerase sporulation-specific sigma factor